MIESDELETFNVLLFNIDRRSIRPLPEMTVLEYTVDLSRISGFRPTKKQPVPGTKM